MKKFNILKTLMVIMSVSSTNLYAEFLTPEEIEEATKLATSTIKYTPSASEEKDKKGGPWLTLEKFQSDYTIFLVGNTINENGFGEIALYHGYTKPEKINLTSPGRFSDIKGERYLSTLRYEYRPKENDIFVQSLVTDKESSFWPQNHRACLDYFMDEFVLKRTGVTHMTAISGLGIPELGYQTMSPFKKGEDGYIHWHK